MYTLYVCAQEELRRPPQYLDRIQIQIRIAGLVLVAENVCLGGSKIKKTVVAFFFKLS